jgi:hypothetical protein
MDNVQNCGSYINIPSSETYRSYPWQTTWLVSFPLSVSKIYVRSDTPELACTIHRSFLYQAVRGNVSLLPLLLLLESTPSLEPLMSKQWVIKWGPGREWACGARTGCSPYETRVTLYETELRSPLPTSEFYEGLGTAIFTLVTSLRNLSCVTEAGTKLRGRNCTDANGQGCTGTRLCLGVVRAPCAFKTDVGSTGTSLAGRGPRIIRSGLHRYACIAPINIRSCQYSLYRA